MSTIESSLRGGHGSGCRHAVSSVRAGFTVIARLFGSEHSLRRGMDLNPRAREGQMFDRAGETIRRAAGRRQCVPINSPFHVARRPTSVRMLRMSADRSSVRRSDPLRSPHEHSPFVPTNCNAPPQGTSRFAESQLKTPSEDPRRLPIDNRRKTRVFRSPSSMSIGHHPAS